jgi:hypothetical protein
MEFLKELLVIQHELVLQKISESMTKEDKDKLYETYNKRNFCSLKLVRSDPIYRYSKKLKCVSLDDLLNKYYCNHNLSVT